jgi:hypothetical protein
MFSSARKRTLCFIVLIVAAFSLSGCPGADETWALVQLLTQGEQTISNIQTPEVRNCGGLPEKKTVQCSAGTESNMTISSACFRHVYTKQIDRDVQNSPSISRTTLRVFCTLPTA